MTPIEKILLIAIVIQHIAAVGLFILMRRAQRRVQLLAERHLWGGTDEAHLEGRYTEDLYR